MQVAFLNGKFIPLVNAKVSILDRGFLYGDGVFETMRSYQGRIFQLEGNLHLIARIKRAPFLGGHQADFVGLMDLNPFFNELSEDGPAGSFEFHLGFEIKFAEGDFDLGCCFSLVKVDISQG